MIHDDETDPKTRRPRLRPLDKMSVPELKDYIRALQEEILRVEQDIGKKEGHKSAADALFGGKA